MSWHPDVTNLSAGGYRFALLEQGAGDAVILVHGITTYSFIWRKVLPRFAHSHRVIAYDLLGCGFTDKPLDVSYSLAEHAERLAVLLNQLGLEQVHLVGHDVGGGIAQIFTVRYPEKVIDLCLVNSVGYNYWPVQPISTMRTPILRHFAMATLDAGALGLIVKRGLYHKKRLDSELLALFRLPFQTSLGRKAFLHFARCLDMRDLTRIEGDLQQLEKPVLIIRGEADSYLSDEISLRFKRDIPGCHLLRIATAGHFIQEDEPEQLATALESFWSDSPMVGVLS